MKVPFFPSKTIEKMRILGVSESQIVDVFNTGDYKTSENGSKMAIKRISNFELGCFYDQNSKTGEYVITGVWKRDRI